jgi:hypothetical protein
MAITLRNTKGLPLTHVELDGNFTDLDTRLSTIESATDSDNQTLTLTGTNLSISGGNTVDLSSFLDNTNTFVSSASFNNATGDLTLTKNDASTVVVNLDGRYLTSVTESQTLSLTGDTLSISGGNSVDLSKYTDSTFSGDFDDLTDNPFTRSIVGSPTPSVEVSFTGNVFDFGDGKTIDMQNSSILFTSSTITGFAPGEITQNDTVAGPFGTDTYTTSIVQDESYTKLNKTDVISQEFSGPITLTSSYLFGSNGVRFEGGAVDTTFTLRNNTTSGTLEIGSGNGNPVNGERDGGNINIFAGAVASGGVGGNVIINSNSGDIFIGPLANTGNIKIGGGSSNEGNNYFGGIPTIFYGPVNFNSQTVTGTNFLTSVAFGDLTSTPTTLSGYGITDAATSAQGALANTAVQPSNNSGVAYQFGYSAFDAVSVPDGVFSVNGTDIVVSMTASTNAQGTRIDISGITTATSAGTGLIYIERRINSGAWLTWNAFAVYGASDHFSHSFIDFYDTDGLFDITTGDTVQYRIINGTSNSNFGSNVSGNINFQLFFGFQFTATEIPLSYGLIQP